MKCVGESDVRLICRVTHDMEKRDERKDFISFFSVLDTLYTERYNKTYEKKPD